MDTARLNKLKVAYVYNFTKFIEWRNGPTKNFTICLFTKNLELIKEFSHIEKRGPSIKVMEDQPEINSDSTSCQIIYLGSEAQKISNDFSGLNTLLVSETKNKDAQIYFVLIDNKLRFSIGKERAEQMGLSISSKLLRLAHEVY